MDRLFESRLNENTRKALNSPLYVILESLQDFDIKQIENTLDVTVDLIPSHARFKCIFKTYIVH